MLVTVITTHNNSLPPCADIVLFTGHQGDGSDVLVLLWQEKVAKLPLSVMRFTPDGSILAVGAHDNTVRLFDVKYGSVAAAANGAVDAEPCRWDSRARRVVEPSGDVEGDDSTAPSPALKQAAVLPGSRLQLRVAVDGGKRKHVTIEKHSSVVTHLDWSSDRVPLVSRNDPSVSSSQQSLSLASSRSGEAGGGAEAVSPRWVLQSTSASYELLYFDDCGKVVMQTQRDTGWASWSCVLGFPVMGMWCAAPGYQLLLVVLIGGRCRREGMDGTDINSCDRTSAVSGPTGGHVGP